jgi:predicted nucleic acid-binding protein
MKEPIVSDAGPLISFARAGQLYLLRQVVGHLQILEAVRDEIVVKGAGRPAAAEVAQGGWVASQPLPSTSLTDPLPTSLGKGEKEAIALCREIGACLLADDPVARREARSRGIALISLLDILDEAKAQDLISDVKPTLDHFIRSGFRLKRTLYEAKIREAGEQ